MAKPGMIIMAIICMAAFVASCGGSNELFTPETPEARQQAE